MKRVFTKLALLSTLLASRGQQPSPPPNPSGWITLAWDWPTNLIGPLTLQINCPAAGYTNALVTNNVIFELWASADITNVTQLGAATNINALTNFYLLATATNATTCQALIQPVGARFIAVRAVGFWGPTFFSNGLWVGPVLPTGTNLTARRSP